MCKTNTEFADETRCPKKHSCPNCKYFFDNVASIPVRSLIAKFPYIKDIQNFTEQCRTKTPTCINDELKDLVSGFYSIFSKNCVRSEIVNEIKLLREAVGKFRTIFDSQKIRSNVTFAKLGSEDNIYFLASTCFNIVSAILIALLYGVRSVKKLICTQK